MTDQSVLHLEKFWHTQMARRADPHKKENIITAAISVFSKSGYAGARISDVAQKAGIGKGTVYEYFQSKEALFFATFEYLMEGTERQVAGILNAIPGSAAERLAATGEAIMKTWMPHLNLYGLILEYWSATTSLPGRKQFKSAFCAAYTEFRHNMAILIKDGIEKNDFRSDVEPENLASALIGAWDALLLQAWLDPDFDPLSASRTHMEVVIAGLQQSI